MKPVSVLVLVAIFVLGCSKPTEEATNQSPAATPNASGSASDPGISPVGGGAAAGMAPVTNPGAVEGAGAGSVGQAAKDMARRKAATGSSSLNQMPTDEGQ
jgi:hypothetical protein